MICPNCGRENEEGSKFCISCGTDLSQGKKVAKETSPAVKEITPAKQAAQMGERTKKVWKGFSLSEKIMCVGVLVSLIAFFLPWLSGKDLVELFELAEKGGTTLNGLQVAKSFGWIYLHPFLMLVSLGLVYFSQGASNFTKILLARWQIVIGTVFTFEGVGGIIVFSKIISFIGDMAKGFGGYFGGPTEANIAIGIGWWLLTFGAIAILVGAFRIQKELLK